MIGRHRLEILDAVPSGPLASDGSDRGHVSRVETVVATVAGVIQPKSAIERSSPTADDVEVETHRIYLEAAAIPLVDEDMKLRKSSATNGDPDPDLDGTYRINGIQNAAGMGHHLEVDAVRIRS